MHHTAPVYLTELSVAVSTHQGRANLRSAAREDTALYNNVQIVLIFLVNVQLLILLMPVSLFAYPL